MYSDVSYFINPDTCTPTNGYENYLLQCSPALQEEYFDIVESYAQNRPGRYLDVGCGTGGVVKVALQRSWDAVGQEISDWAATEGAKAGVTIVNATLLDAHFDADSFDAISMFDVLEHLPLPGPYMLEIHRILRPGGVLLLETPNIDGFFARYVYGDKSDLIKPRAHICLYGPRNVRRLLSAIPFSGVEIRTFPYCRKYTLAYWKGVLASRILPDRIPVQLTVNESLRVVCWK
jgi:SAM-dependent methyltransferase